MIMNKTTVMKLFLLPLVFPLVLSLFAVNSHAQFYVEAGPSYLYSSDFDSILNWDYRAGYTRGVHSLEVHSGAYAFDNDELGFEQDLKVTPIVINYVRDFGGAGKFDYEAGIGAGVGITDFEVTADLDGEDAVLLGQVFGRALYDFTENIDGVVELKAVYLGEANEGDFAIDAQFMAGPTFSLRYTF